MKKLIYILLMKYVLLSLSSCYSLEGYRKVTVVNEKLEPLKGVNRFPMQFYGKGSRTSNKEGQIWIPAEVYFFLKRGYKTLDISENMQNNDVFIMKKEDSPSVL